MTTEERLEKLERDLLTSRRCNRLLMVGVVLVVSGFSCRGSAHGTGPDVQETAGIMRVVRAGRFELVDENGKARANLGMTKDGPSLLLYDERGNGRAALGVTQDGPGLNLAADHSEARVVLAVTIDGPVLRLDDEKGKPRVGLGVPKNGPMIGLLDANGKAIWRAP